MDCCKSNPDNYKFCAVCGTRLERLLCDCGYTNTVKNIYCGNCGKDLNKQNHSSSLDNPNQVRSEKFDLQKLVSSIKKTSSEESKENQKSDGMNQDDIKEMFSALRNKDDN